MKNIPSYISELLGSHGVINQEEIETCRYGIEIFITSVFELLSVLTISLFCRNFINTVIFFSAFIPLRIYAGGYHADTRLKCYLILLLVYATFSFLIKHITKRYILPLEFFSVLLTAFMILLFSPIINDKKNINEVETVFYKKVSVKIMIIEILIILSGMFIKSISEYILSFSLGQLAVSLSMIAAFVKTKLEGGKINEKG